jgi:hypothetical protein
MSTTPARLWPNIQLGQTQLRVGVLLGEVDLNTRDDPATPALRAGMPVCTTPCIHYVADATCTACINQGV